MRAPPRAASWLKAVIVVGVGSSHDGVRYGVRRWLRRAKFGSWQDRPPCFLYGPWIFLMEVAEEVSGANKEPVSTMMLYGPSNSLSGAAAWGRPSSRPADQNGQGVAARLRRVVMTTQTSVGAPSPEVALKELLRGQGVYEVGAAGVDLAPHRSNLVSLAASLEGSPNLADLLPPEVRFFLGVGEQELMRRTREETRAHVEDGGVVSPYMDSALRHNRKRYLTFLRQLRSRGILNFVEQAKAHAGVFFVWKSFKTKLRFIIDARPGNMFYKFLPAVGLCSSETF